MRRSITSTQAWPIAVFIISTLILLAPFILNFTETVSRLLVISAGIAYVSGYLLHHLLNHRKLPASVSLEYLIMAALLIFIGLSIM